MNERGPRDSLAGLENLEVLERRGIEDEVVGVLVDPEVEDVPEVALVARLGIAERRAGGRDARVSPLEAESTERLRAEVPREQGQGRVAVEERVVDGRERQRAVPARGLAHAPRVEQLARRDARQIVLEARVVAPRVPGDEEISGGDVQVRGAEPVGRGGDRDQVAAVALEKVALHRRPRRDHADDLPPDDPFRRGRIFHLIADRHPEPFPDELRDVRVGRVVRDPAHRGLPFASLAAGREHEAQDRGRRLGVFEEHLVEVAETIEEDRVRHLPLDLEVLLEHRGEFDGWRHWLGLITASLVVDRWPLIESRFAINDPRPTINESAGEPRILSAEDFPHPDRFSLRIELDDDRLVQTGPDGPVEEHDPARVGRHFPLARPGHVHHFESGEAIRVALLQEAESRVARDLARNPVPPARRILHLDRLHHEKEDRASRDPQQVENPESAKPRRFRHAAYNTAMERAALEHRILEVVRGEKTLPDVPLTPETQLADLGIDSLDALNILFALEEAFGISIPDEVSRQIRTLGDLTAAIRGSEGA